MLKYPRQSSVPGSAACFWSLVSTGTLLLLAQACVQVPWGQPAQLSLKT